MKFWSLLGISALLAVSLAAQATGPSSSVPAVKGEPTVPALMLAVQSGDAVAVDQLLKRGADPNQTDAGGATALMWAIPDIEKVRRLVAAGANVNARSTNTGRTPLLIAANYPGTVELLELLLARGADLRARDAAGFTALGLAMLAADVEVVRFLVEQVGSGSAQVPDAERRHAHPRRVDRCWHRRDRHLCGQRNRTRHQCRADSLVVILYQGRLGRRALTQRPSHSETLKSGTGMAGVVRVDAAWSGQ